MIKVITSKNNERVKFACSLKENKNRKIHKMFLAETFKSLDMALKNNLVVEIFEKFEYHLSKEIFGTLNENKSLFIKKL